MTRNDQELTIIVLTYYSAHLIKECLSKLDFDSYKIVVIDNASQDNTVGIVQENFPLAEIIKLKKNIGYGNANNIALEQTNTDFALILNPDAFISKEDIEKILAVMKSNNRIALAGPLQFDKNPATREMIEPRIDAINKDITGLKSDFYHKLSEHGYSGAFICGSICFMNIKICREIGFFDKNIFLYFEDNELSNRVVKHGYINALMTDSHGYHIGGKSSQKSLRILYLRSWHLEWSRLYWHRTRHRFFRSKIYSILLTLQNFVKFLVSVLILDAETSVRYLGSTSGSFSFLIGLKAV